MTHSFLESPARAFEESPGRARNTYAARSVVTEACNQWQWDVRACTVHCLGGMGPWDWVTQTDGVPPSYTPDVIYRKLTHTLCFTDWPDENTHRARWIKEEIWFHPSLGDIYKYALSSSVDGDNIHTWERDATGAVTETGQGDAVTPPANQDDVRYGLAQYWTVTKTKTTWTEQAVIPGFPTGDAAFDFAIENNKDEWVLSDPTDVNGIITTAKNACEALPMRGDITIVTNWATMATETYSLEVDQSSPGTTDFTQDWKYYIQQFARTAGGIVALRSQTTSPGTAITPIQGERGLAPSVREPRAGTCLHSNAPAGGWKPSTPGWIAIGNVIPTMGSDYYLATSRYGVWASSGRWSIALADGRYCEMAYRYTWNYFEHFDGPWEDFSGLPSYDFRSETRSDLPAYWDHTGSRLNDGTPCWSRSDPDWLYEDLPPCRDLAAPCVTIIERTPEDLDDILPAIPNGLGYLTLHSLHCSASCADIDGCPQFGNP